MVVIQKKEQQKNNNKINSNNNEEDENDNENKNERKDEDDNYESYSIDWEQIIEIFGKPRNIFKGINQNWTWVSENYKMKTSNEKYIKICYCFHFYYKNCKDTKNFLYIGLVHNHIWDSKTTIMQNELDTNYEISNMIYFNKDSIKFVAINSFNDLNRNVCDNINYEKKYYYAFFFWI